MNRPMTKVLMLLLYLFGALFAGLTMATLPVLLRAFTATNLLVVLVVITMAIVSFYKANKIRKSL